MAGLRVAQSTDWQRTSPEFDFIHGGTDFSLHQHVRVGSETYPPMYFRRLPGVSFPEYEPVGLWISPKPSSCMRVKNVRSCTSLSQYVFVRWQTCELCSEASLVVIQNSCPICSILYTGPKDRMSWKGCGWNRLWRCLTAGTEKNHENHQWWLDYVPATPSARPSYIRKVLGSYFSLYNHHYR